MLLAFLRFGGLKFNFWNKLWLIRRLLSYNIMNVIVLSIIISLAKAQIIQQNSASVVMSLLQRKELHKLLYHSLSWRRYVVILVYFSHLRGKNAHFFS
jgi:hypothetical protein